MTNKLLTLNEVGEIEAVCEALKGVKEACDITYAKPEFVDYIRVCSPAAISALCATVRELEARVVELERRLRIPFGKLPCALCGGPHDFDTSVPSVVWNAVIRTRDLPDYLCTTCIVREFVRARQGFTAQLWNEEFNGVSIEVVVEGQAAQDAALVQAENNSLRNQLSMMDERAISAAKEIVASVSLPDAISVVEEMRDEWQQEREKATLMSGYRKRMSHYRDAAYYILTRLRALSPGETHKPDKTALEPKAAEIVEKVFRGYVTHLSVRTAKQLAMEAIGLVLDECTSLSPGVAGEEEREKWY
jgi:hypothetical protein